MSFDMPQDNAGYPCDCGGSVEPDGLHYVGGSICDLDPPEPCCNIWVCDKCGKTFYEHDNAEESR
jgi:hypothetical protein